MATKQTNLVANPERYLIFSEGDELVYNYKTDQWSRVPAYDALGMFSVRDKTKDIGLIRYSSGSVDIQSQATSDDAQAAILATGASDFNTGGRCVVTGVRPLVNMPSGLTVQVGGQDDVGDSTDWTATTSVYSRTNMANFRKEGRYMRILVNATGFNTLIGADVEWTEAGEV